MAAAPLPVFRSSPTPTINPPSSNSPSPDNSSPAHHLSDNSLSLPQFRVKKSSKLRDTERWARQTSSQRSSPDIFPPSPKLIHSSSIEPIHSTAPPSIPSSSAATTTLDPDRPRLSLQPVPHLRALQTLEPDNLLQSEHATVNEWQSENTLPSAHYTSAPPQTLVSLSPIDVQFVAQTPTSAELLAPPITIPSGTMIGSLDDPLAHSPLTPSISDRSRPRTAPEPITPPPDPLLRARISLQEALSATPQARSNPTSPHHGSQPQIASLEGYSDHSSEAPGEADDGSGSGLSPINEDRTAELAAEHSWPISRVPSRTPPRPVSSAAPRRVPSPRSAIVPPTQPGSTDHTLASVCSSGCEDCAAQRTASSQVQEDGGTQTVSLDEERTSQQTVSSVRSSDEVVLPNAAAAVAATLSARRQAMPLSVRTNPSPLQRPAPPLSLPASARRPMPGDVLSRLEMEEWRHQTGVDDRYALPLPVRPGEGSERSLVGLGGEERRGMKDRWGNSWGLEAHVLSPLSERTERSLTTVGSCLSLSTRQSVHSLRSLDSTAHSLAQRLDQAAEVAGTRKLKLGPALVPSAVVRTVAVLRTASCPTGASGESGLGEDKIKKKEERKARREKREKRRVDEQRRSESLASKQERRRLEKRKKEMFLEKKQDLLRQLQEHPTNPTLVRDLGILYLSCNAGLAGLKLAIRHLEASLQMNDCDPVSWSSLGKAWAAVHTLGYGAESEAEVLHQTHNATIGLRKAIMNSRTAQEARVFKIEWARYLERLGRWRDSLGVVGEVIKNEGRQTARCWAALGFIGQRIVFGWQPLTDISIDELEEGFLPGRQPAPGPPVAGLSDADRAKLLVQVREAFERALGMLDPSVEQNKRYAVHYIYQLERVCAAEQEMRAQGLGITESLASECAGTEPCHCTPMAPSSVGGGQTREVVLQGSAPTRALDQDQADERDQQQQGGDRLGQASEQAVGRAPVVVDLKQQMQASGRLGSPARLESSLGRLVGGGGEEAVGERLVESRSDPRLSSNDDDDGRARRKMEVSPEGLTGLMSEGERKREMDGREVGCDPEPTSYRRLMVSPPSGRAQGQAVVPDKARWRPTGPALVGNLGTVIDPDGCSDAEDVVAVQYDDVDTTNDYSEERGVELVSTKAHQLLSPLPVSEEPGGGSTREYVTPLSSADIGGGGGGGGLGEMEGGTSLGGQAGPEQEDKKQSVGGWSREEGSSCATRPMQKPPGGGPRLMSKSPSGRPRPAVESPSGSPRPISKSPSGCPPRPAAESPRGCPRPISMSPSGRPPRPAAESPSGCPRLATESPSGVVLGQCRDQPLASLLDSRSISGDQRSQVGLGSPCCCRSQADSQASLVGLEQVGGEGCGSKELGGGSAGPVPVPGLDEAKLVVGSEEGCRVGEELMGESRLDETGRRILMGSPSRSNTQADLRTRSALGLARAKEEEDEVGDGGSRKRFLGRRSPFQDQVLSTLGGRVGEESMGESSLDGIVHRTLMGPPSCRSQVDAQTDGQAGSAGSKVDIGSSPKQDQVQSPAMSSARGECIRKESGFRPRSTELGHRLGPTEFLNHSPAISHRPLSQASSTGNCFQRVELESRDSCSRATGDDRLHHYQTRCSVSRSPRGFQGLLQQTQSPVSGGSGQRGQQVESPRPVSVCIKDERVWSGCESSLRGGSGLEASQEGRQSRASRSAGEGQRVTGGLLGLGSNRVSAGRSRSSGGCKEEGSWGESKQIRSCCSERNDDGDEKLNEIERCKVIAILEMEREYYKRRKQLRKKLEQVEEEYEERRVQMLESLCVKDSDCSTQGLSKIIRRGEDCGGGGGGGEEEEEVKEEEGWCGEDAGRFNDADECRVMMMSRGSGSERLDRRSSSRTEVCSRDRDQLLLSSKGGVEGRLGSKNEVDKKCAVTGPHLGLGRSSSSDDGCRGNDRNHQRVLVKSSGPAGRIDEDLDQVGLIGTGTGTGTVTGTVTGTGTGTGTGRIGIGGGNNGNGHANIALQGIAAILKLASSRN